MENSNTFHIMVLYKEFLAYTERLLKEQGLNFGKLPFILYIGNHSGCTPSDVKNALRMDWGHVQRSIARLEQDGFVQKEKDEKKDRISHLTLTAQGKTAFEMSHHAFYSWDEELKSTLSQEEWAEFSKIMELLVRQRKERWQDEGI